MSNEELVAAIQAGQAELMPQLWENVEKLIAWRANRFLSAISATGLCHGVEIGDLINSSYFAVLAAVKTYDPSKGKFSAWLMLFLRTAFAEATGYRTEKQKNDPMRYVLSLDAPLDEEDGDTIGDMQADPTAGIPFDVVDAGIYWEQLRKELDKMIGDLSPQQAEVIRRRYWNRETLEQIGASGGISIERVRQIEDQSLRALQTPQHRARLEKFLDRKTPYYLHVGPCEFQRTRTSSTEKIILIRERMRERQKGKIYESSRMVKSIPCP